MLKKIRRWLDSPRGGKVRRVAVGVAGTLTILLGVVFIFIPGPAFLVLPAGFAILALEFEWAAKAYNQGRDWLVAKGWLKKDQAKLKTGRATGKT